MERVKEFLESDQKVFLLLGDSGAGKSAFSLELEHELWRSYKNKADRIPLHINLPGIDKPEHDMVAKQLRRVEFTEPQIREMKHYRKLVLICDGYDESQQTHNLYMSNRMNQSGEWDVKMIVSCRTEYLGADYRDRFQPGDRNQQSKSSLFQEAVITPFTLNMVHAYIHRYVAIHQPLWQLEDYKQALELIPSLKDLVTNPFLMSLSLEVLPRMVDPGQHLSSRRVTRVELYDHFVEQWLERNKKRLGEMGMAPQAREEFERLIAEGFTVNGIGYMKKFALAIYKEQDGQPVVEYSQLVDEGTWKDEFFKFRDKQLLHEASPLARSGNQHRFIHRSLLEYSLSRAIFDPEDRKNRIPTEALLGRRGSLSSTLSFEIQDGTEQTAWIGKEPDFDSPLVSRSFVKDYSFLHFLEERVLQEPMFKEQLLKYIEYSKKDAKWRKAAANAITILVRAGVQFIGADLRGIRIPGADLSFGIFDSAQLQDADLRKVNLEYVAMRKTDLRRAQMTGVQFGEMPSLEVHSAVYSCAYSPDGKLFAVGSEYISLYTTSNWKRIGERRSGGVRCIIYSPRGDQVAACGYDSTVHLLDSETGSLLGTLTDNTNYVLSVAYSPQGDRIASVSGDGRVRLWDVASGKCRHTFTGLHSSIKCVEYSPNDHQIAAGGEDRRAYLWNTETGATHILSGHRGIVLIIKYSSRGDRVASASEDTTVRIWNVDTGACCHILTGHRGTVLAINYSSRGDQVASASEDTTARIWDVETGTCRHILIGHISPITSVAFSPKGDQIVSGSTDKTAKLWDTETGHCRQTLTGHTGSVNCVAFSPGGDHIASGSEDRTVRLCGISSRPVSSSHSAELYGVKCSSRGDLVASCGLDGIIRFWSADTGAHRLTLNGHNDSVFNIAFSPQGDLIASGSADMTVRLWDVDSGACLQILIGHTDYVVDVAYFPQGDMIASGSIDKSVRLWDTATRECRSVFTGLSGVMSVSISPDGDQIASGTREHLVRIWDPKTGVCSGTLEYFDSRALEVAYLPQGNQLASAGHGKTIFIWDMKTRRRRLILNGHTDRVRCLAFSPQGDLLASGCCDMTVRLWDVVSGRCLTVIESFRGPVYSVVWVTTSGTNYLVTGSGDGSLLKWEIVKEAEQYSARLLWSAVNGTLTLAGASIQDVRGLSPINKQLLEQRGAIGKTSAGLVS
jgi:WD40 repeat protein